MRSNASLLLVSLLLLAAACGAGGGPEKLDTAALKEGASHTAKLKFWAKGSGYSGDTLLENLHFDDAANTRHVFLIDPAAKDAAGKLQQGTVYAVTFTYKPGDPLIKGTMTAVK